MNNAVRKREPIALMAVTNVVLLTLLLLFAVAFIYGEFFYQPEVDPQGTVRYLEVARERIDEHSGEISAEAARLAEEALPPIGSAIYSQVREDYPRYLRTLKHEGQTYLGNAEAMLTKQVKARYREYLRQHRDVIRQEFPDHGSDENIDLIVRDFERTADRLLERYYLDEFRREADRTVALWSRVDPLRVPEADEPSLPEQLTDYAADWTVLAVAGRAEEAAFEQEQTEE